MRIVAEIVIFFGAILYLLSALREAQFLGYKMFIENLVSTVYLEHFQNCLFLIVENIIISLNTIKMPSHYNNF